MNVLHTIAEFRAYRRSLPVDALTPFASGLLEPTEGLDLLEAEGIYPKAESDMFESWRQTLESVAQDAGLTLVLQPGALAAVGGRHGKHSEAFLPLLDKIITDGLSPPRHANALCYGLDQNELGPSHG